MNWEAFLANLSPALVVAILFVTLVVEGTGLPWVPYEPVFVVVGQLAEVNRLNPLVAIAVGSAGNLLGNLIGYWVGRRAGRALVERHGHRIHLGEEEMRLVEGWFGRYGAVTTLVGRFFGVIRTPAILMAGLAGMDLRRYVLYSALGAAVWTAVWVYGAVTLDRLIPPRYDGLTVWFALLAGFSVFLVPPLARRYFRHHEHRRGG